MQLTTQINLDVAVSRRSDAPYTLMSENKPQQQHCDMSCTTRALAILALADKQ